MVIRKVALIATVIFLGGSLEKSHALSTFKPTCSVEFDGVVTNIAKAEAPFLNSQFLEKIRVTFSITQTLKGEVHREKELVVLKHGPVRFQKEKSYRISVNNDLLCNVKEI